MLKKIIALGGVLGMTVSMVNASECNQIKGWEFLAGEGGEILDNIIENCVMPSEETLQRLFDLSKNVEGESIDVVLSHLLDRWRVGDKIDDQTGEIIFGYVPKDKLELAESIYEKLCAIAQQQLKL